jgi:hypothetical protein
MRHVTCCISAFIMLLALAGSAWAAGVPWKDAGDEAAATATQEEVKADIGEVRYNRLVEPIEAKVKLAEKAMEPYEKEQQKPPEQRRPQVLQQCKVRSAQMYVAAAQQAMRAQRMVQKSSHRAYFKEEFEKPNRDKAVRIYLDLGMEVRAGGNIPQAAMLYKQALGMDPDNTEAKAALRELALEYQQAMKDQKYRSRNAGGGDDDQKRSWDWDRDADYKRDWGNWRNYTGNGGGGWW